MDEPTHACLVVWEPDHRCRIQERWGVDEGSELLRRICESEGRKMGRCLRKTKRISFRSRRDRIRVALTFGCVRAATSVDIRSSIASVRRGTASFLFSSPPGRILAIKSKMLAWLRLRPGVEEVGLPPGTSWDSFLGFDAWRSEDRRDLREPRVEEGRERKVGRWPRQAVKTSTMSCEEEDFGQLATMEER